MRGGRPEAAPRARLALKGSGDGPIVGAAGAPGPRIPTERKVARLDSTQRLYEEHGPRDAVRKYEEAQCKDLNILGRRVPRKSGYQPLPLFRKLDPDKELARESRLEKRL